MSWYESSIITDLSLVSISTDRIYLFCFGIVVVFSSWRWISKFLGSILTFSLHGEEKSSRGAASMINHEEPYVWLFYVVCKLWLEPYFAFSVHHGQYNESDWIFNVSLPADFTAWRQNLCIIGLKLLKKWLTLVSLVQFTCSMASFGRHWRLNFMSMFMYKPKVVI